MDVFLICSSIWAVIFFTGWAIYLGANDICEAIRKPREIVIRFDDCDDDEDDFDE